VHFEPIKWFWLLSNALVDAFTLVSNLQEEVHAMEAFFQPLVLIQNFNI
jgi:hypothetical protein